jgi:hypothetical protein
VDYDLPGRFCNNPRIDWTSLLTGLFRRGVIHVMPRVKQFELRIAKRPGLPGEIASALWQKGVHIQAFSADLQEGEGRFHLAVDKAAVAKQTFFENGWKATED